VTDENSEPVALAAPVLHVVGFRIEVLISMGPLELDAPPGREPCSRRWRAISHTTRQKVLRALE
jgi:hypothetical protein